MQAPLILGGIAVPLHAGPPEVTYAPAGGHTDLTMSDGRPLRMRHWRKEVITISGTGWMATGLDALDWDAQHLLLCPKPKRMTVTAPVAVLPSTPRPDVPVHVHALVGRDWVSTPHVRVGQGVDITPVAGASLYTVAWHPQYTVLVTPPSESLGGGEVSWQLICREV